MTDKDEQLERMRAAVERKAAESEARSHDGGGTGARPSPDEDGAGSHRGRPPSRRLLGARQEHGERQEDGRQVEPVTDIDVDALRDRNQAKAEAEAARGPARAESDAAPIGDAIIDFHPAMRSRSASRRPRRHR
jgi:hypothetical protein